MTETLAVDAKEIGRRVRALREGKGWSLRDLAGRCGLSRSSISDVERAVSESPGIEKLAAIARGLGVGIDTLISPIGERPGSELEARADAIAREWLGLPADKRELVADFMKMIAQREPSE
jgi:transcriptional regulator with XRE-family HTH domain